MPALPGAQNKRSTSGDAAIPQARECSRPPDPTTSTRIALPPALGYHVGMDDTSVAAPVRSNIGEYTVSELARALKKRLERDAYDTDQLIRAYAAEAFGRGRQA